MAMAALPSPGNHRYLGKGGREEVPRCWQENSRQGLNAQHGFCFPPCATTVLVTAGSGLSLPFSLELHLLVSRPPPAQTLPLHLLSHSSLDWSLCFLNWICSYWGREATPTQGEGGKPRGLIPERHMLQWPHPCPPGVFLQVPHEELSGYWQVASRKQEAERAFLPTEPFSSLRHFLLVPTVPFPQTLEL